MSYSFRVCCAIIGTFLFVACATPVAEIHAASTFAQFTEATASSPQSPFPPGSSFGYADNGLGDAELGTVMDTGLGDPIPVNFNFLNQAGLPADLLGIQDATMTMTSSTTAPVVTGFGGTVGSQLFDGKGELQNVITFTRNTPAAEGFGAHTNLLTVTFTAQLTGMLGGQTASLTADTLTGFTVNYTSDFLNFSSNADANFALAFTSWLTPNEFAAIASSGPLAIDSTSQNFFAALATGAGSFAGGSSVSIPEPSTCVLAVLGLAFLGMAGRRRLKAK
ncbi:MAG TPA: PEP-CTERM sorting domain-containing protein [Pirellulales bacterium]|jgi:hypothetical protein